MTKEDIMKRAIHDCMKEMYFKAQPSVDYDELVEKKKSGLIVDTNEDPIYNRYYLSQAEFEYIREKYIEAYGFKSTWKPNVEIVEDYLINGGTKDKYVPSRMDETGFVHPGYRSYEKVHSLLHQLTDILGDEKAKEVCNIVMDNINECKEFYRFDRSESDFSLSVTLGASPTSNKETVMKYWEEHGSPVEIVDRNPLLLWEMDNYGDEFEEVMEEEYGENWKERWDNKYKKQQEEKRLERERKYEELVNSKPSPKFSVYDEIRREGNPKAYQVCKVEDDRYIVCDVCNPLDITSISFEDAKEYEHTYESWKKKGHY